MGRDVRQRLVVSERKGRDLEQKVKLFTNQLKEKKIQLYRLKWGLSTSNVSGSTSSSSASTISSSPSSTISSTPISPTRSSYHQAVPTPFSPPSVRQNEQRYREASLAAAARVEAEKRR